MESSTYTPIMKAHAGEIKAFARLPERNLSDTCPIFEMTAPNEGETVEAAIGKMIRHMTRRLDDVSLAVDLLPIEPQIEIDGIPATTYVYRTLDDHGITTHPVLHLDSENPLWENAGQHLARTGTRLFVRIELDDLETKEETVLQLIDRVLSIGIQVSKAHIVLDCRYVGDLGFTDSLELQQKLANFIDYSTTAGTWGGISIVGSSIPKTVEDVPKNGEVEIERVELSTYLSVAELFPAIRLQFGDYGIVNPDFSIKGPAPNANAKIRYTFGANQHIFRGHSLREGSKYEQYFDLAERVTRSPCYLGPEYSYGDAYIRACADHLAGPGNLGTWVEVDTNHHLSYVSNKLPAIIEATQRRSSVARIIEELA